MRLVSINEAVRKEKIMKVSVDTTKKKKEEPMTGKKRFMSLLRSLVKNDAVKDNKNIPWWLAIILFLVSIILSIIPPVVQNATEKGSYVLTNSTYTMDVGLEAFGKFLYEEKIDFVIQKDADSGEITLENVGENLWSSNDKLVKTYGNNNYCYEYSVNTNDEKTSPRFRVFYKPGEKNPSNNRTPAYDFFYSNETFGVASKTNSDPEKEEYVKPTSFMVIGTYEIFIAIYKPGATKNTDYTGTPFRGSYSRMLDNDTTSIHLHSLLLSSEASKEAIAAVENFSETTPNFVAPENSRWISFLNRAYSLTRMNNTLMIFSMISGLNALIILVYGFTLWILTRGKRNPNRDLKIGETMKMSCVASLSPAILSLIIGFIIPSFASLSFILFTSLRLMWLSMRTLRPVQE